MKQEKIPMFTLCYCNVPKVLENPYHFETLRWIVFKMQVYEVSLAFGF